MQYRGPVKCVRYACVYVCLWASNTGHPILSFILASVASCHKPVSFTTLHLLGWIWYLEIMDWSSKRRMRTGNFSRGRISWAIGADSNTHTHTHTCEVENRWRAKRNVLMLRTVVTSFTSSLDMKRRWKQLQLQHNVSQKINLLFIASRV